MAKDKKSFILYADQIGLFEALPDAEAGRLIKTIFQYINDKNPEIKDVLLRVAFEPIKLQLKRDLKNWEAERSGRSEAGKKGMASRWKNKITKDNSVIPVITKITDTVNVTVTDTVNDNVIDIHKYILSEVENGKTVQFCKITLHRDYDNSEISELWEAFLINGKQEFYTGPAKMIKHFRNWIKTQPHETDRRINSRSNAKPGTSDFRTEKVRNWPATNGAK